jgi:hypothetical protein
MEGTNMSTATEKQLAKLREIGGVPEGQYFAQPIAVNALVKAGWVEQHPTLKNPKNDKEKATRLTDAGRALIAEPGQQNQTGGTQPSGEASTVSSFKIIDLAKPAQTRNLDNSNYKYPFDQLGNGQAFFVAAKDGTKSPAKAFASTLATANKRWNTKEDFRHFSSRSMLGDAFGDEFKGKKGVGIFRDTAEEEAKAKTDFFS